MTSAERQRRYRTKVKRLARAARAKAKRNKLAKRAAPAKVPWKAVKPITGADWRECYQQAPSLRVPSMEVCDWCAQGVSEAVQAWSRGARPPVLDDAEEVLRQLLRLLPAVRANFLTENAPDPLTEDHPHFRGIVALELIARETSFLLKRYTDGPDWADLAQTICAYAMGIRWRHQHPLSFSHVDDPLCILVHAILGKMGIDGSRHSVSMALRKRRGREARARLVDRNPT